MHCLISSLKRLVIVLFINQIPFIGVNGSNNTSTSKPITLFSTKAAVSSPVNITTTLKPPLPTQPSTDIPPNTDIGGCPCDLTGSLCDTNCCCDEDCSTDQQKFFSYCISYKSEIDERLCFKEDVIKINAYYKTNVTDNGLLCIYFDNTVERNFYKKPQLITTEEMFSEYKKLFLRSAYRIQYPKEMSFGDFYKSGDYIYMLGPNLLVSYFPFPSTLNSGICLENTPAAYLVDKTVRCIRELKNFTQECDFSSSISISNYIFENFAVVVTPKIFQKSFSEKFWNKTGDSNDDQLYNSKYTVPISNITICIFDCINVAELNKSMTEFFPELCGSNCINTVSKVAYTFVYNGTNGIISVSLTFHLMTLEQTATPFTQTFSIEFRQLGTEYNKYFKRSGNPGYIRGEPLLAGTQTGSEISLSNDRTNWLTIPKTSADGICSGRNRVPVTFDVEMRTSCFVKTNMAEFPLLCKDFYAKFDFLWKQNATHVAMFGNTPVSSVGDWVPILEQNRPPQSQFQAPNHCVQVVTGMEIQVLYAKVGSIYNPQVKIVGISLTYDRPRTISLQCNDRVCAVNYQKEYSIELVTTVAFKDISRSALDIFAKPAEEKDGLPFDFFYPFYSSSSLKNYNQMSTKYLIMIAIFHVILLL
ncbi:tectonic-3-like isoform X1 [Argonauta hians]